MIGMKCTFALYPPFHFLLRYTVESDKDVMLWMLELGKTFLEIFLCSLVADDVESKRT